MGVIKQVVGPGYGRKGQPGTLKLLHQALLGSRFKACGDNWQQPGALRHPPVVVGQACIGGKICKLEGDTKLLPLGVTDDTDKHLLAIDTLKYIVDCPG